MTQIKPHLLINLPPTFFTQPELNPYFDRLADIAELRKTSHNTQDELAPDLAWADAVLMWAWPDLDDGMLDKAPQLRFVGQINTTKATVKACLGRGIAVSEVRHAWSPAVAEMALTLILCGLRKVSDFHAQMRTGTEPWVNDFPREIDLRERELTGRPVGIVGFGRIGQRLAELLKPFNVTLRIYDPYLPAPIAEQYSAVQVPVLDLIRTQMWWCCALPIPQKPAI